VQRKCNWRRRTERRVTKRLRLEEQQDYVFKRVWRLLKRERLRCRHRSNNSSSCNSSSNIFSTDICEVSDFQVETDNELQNSENKDIDIAFENDEQKEKYVILSLREWALSGGILSVSKIDEFLVWLYPVFRNLLKSYKTLGILNSINITYFRNGS